MEYQEALSKALKIQSEISPLCERAEIAGSVRREKPTDIKDIELVVIPKLTTTTDMFGSPSGIESQLESGLAYLMGFWRATSVKWGEKYKQIIFPDATKLDLFIVTAETWGYQFAIRTGPADYSHWLVTPRRHGGALPSYLKVKDARVWNGEKALDTSTEEKFFLALDISTVPHPSERVAKWRS